MIEITLSVLLVLAAIERYLLMRRYEETIESERVAAHVERSELVARVQGLSWRPEPRKVVTEELVEEPDELGMVGTIQYGDDNVVNYTDFPERDRSKEVYDGQQ